MDMRRVLIIGCDGQDGTLLASSLKSTSNQVLGMGRNKLVGLS